MKEYLYEIIRSASTPIHARNKAREYLQALILSGMQKGGAMIPLAFHGGTALRFLYSLPRFSVDLDFALERDAPNFNFLRTMQRVKSELVRMGFEVRIKVQDGRTVQNASIQFPGLLFESGLSIHRNEILAIKVEIDTDPPAGAELSTTVIRRFIPLHIQHHDAASLLAGKLNAILTRNFCKGRDWYDLLWYLSDPKWPEPNLTLLENAFAQKTHEKKLFTRGLWQELIWQRAQSLDFQALHKDLGAFLEDERDLSLLNLENFSKLLYR